LEHWKQVQNNFNAQLQNELQNDGDEHIIFVVLVEQLSENMDEAHKSHGGTKPRHKPIERSITFKFFMIILQCGLFTMTNFLDVIFKCIDNFFSKLWKQ
jgi:hypothetical protein